MPRFAALAAPIAPCPEQDVFWPGSALDLEPESEHPPTPLFYVAADLSDDDVIWIGLA